MLTVRLWNSLSAPGVTAHTYKSVPWAHDHTMRNTPNHVRTSHVSLELTEIDVSRHTPDSQTSTPAQDGPEDTASMDGLRIFSPSTECTSHSA
jgi:hypothetical protein